MPALFANELTITCRRASLLDALAAVAAVVPARSPKEVLRMVRLVADPEGDGGGAAAALEATNLEISIHHRILGVDVGTGQVDVLLPTDAVGKLLRVAEAQPDVVPDGDAAPRPRRKKGGDDDTIAITPGANNVTVAGRRWKAVLPTCPPAEFPPLPRFESANYLAVSAADLARAIRRTMFACDPDSQRYALGGCLFAPTEAGLVVVATDGRQLARQRIAAEPEGAGAPGDVAAVVPPKALKLLLGLLDDDDPPIHLTWAAGTLLVRTGAATLSACLVAGRFPCYENVIPDAAGVRTVVTCGAGDLLDACTRAAVTTSELSRGVDFAFAAGRITLTAQAADVGAGTGELAATLVSGPPQLVTLDVRYLAEMLRPLDRDATLRLELTDPSTPVLVRTDDDYTYVVSTLTPPRPETESGN
jgi:DNA polymerase-3 subunit beta